MPNLRELREKKGSLVKEAQTYLDEAEERAKKEKRPLKEEERQRFDTMMEDVDKLTDEIGDGERRQRLDAESRELDRSQGRKTSLEDTSDDRDGGSEQRKDPRDTPEYRSAVNKWLRGEHRGFTEAEFRALQVDLDTSGGTWVAGEQFVTELIKAVDNEVFMRRNSRTFTVTTADSLGAPSLENNPADPTWTAEIAVGAEDSTMSTGKRSLFPHPLAQYIKVSRTLLRKSVIPAEQIVRDRLAYKIGVVMEAGFLTGHGANQPLGVFTASAEGIPTTRDVSTDNAATMFTADGLINAKYSLKAGYLRNARWIFHRDGVRNARKLKDGDGNYIWRAGLVSDKPDTILDLPYDMSEYAPNTFTTGLYVGIVGDFSYYWIADALSMEIQRLDELYAATNQVGFVSRIESDGMPVLGEAFARVKLG